MSMPQYTFDRLQRGNLDMTTATDEVVRIFETDSEQDGEKTANICIRKC